jgi:hypothetical protein
MAILMFVLFMSTILTLVAVALTSDDGLSNV